MAPSKRTLPDCFACVHSIGVRHKMQDGSYSSYRLYCKFLDGEVYTACSEFQYEPGTDISEIGGRYGVHQGRAA